MCYDLILVKIRLKRIRIYTMANAKNTENKLQDLEGLHQLYQDISKLKELSESLKDIDANVLVSQKILGLARKFSKIDDRIISKFSKAENSGTYFSEVLAYETLRLRFKEEIAKCKNLRQIQA